MYPIMLKQPIGIFVVKIELMNRSLWHQVVTHTNWDKNQYSFHRHI